MPEARERDRTSQNEQLKPTFKRRVNPAAHIRQEALSADEPGNSHEQLVNTIRNLIREQQLLYASHRLPDEKEVLAPETIIRNQLDWYTDTPDKQKGESFFTLRSAWDALAYDRYEIGSREEGLAGSVLQAYYTATHEPTIQLSDPRQVRLLDALTEAAGIPHRRGQAEVEIPQKLRSYTTYQMSGEYQQRWAQAQAKRQK